MGVNGILNINKPCGPTSFSMVAAVRRLSGEKRVGHAGTLDPAASGVLPVLLGQAVRLTEYIHNFTKEYIAGIMLGIITDTLDAQGKTIFHGDATAISEKQILHELQHFTGNIIQAPPVYSAKKVGGKKSYKLARRGASVHLEPKQVIIESIDLLSFQSPYLKIKVRCSTGTYIRSLARDLGEALGCGAYLHDLLRTAYGPYNLDNSLSPDELAGKIQSMGISNLLFPVDHPLQSWQRSVLEDRVAALVLGGTAIHLDLDMLDREKPLCCYDRSGKFLGILKYSNGSGLWWPQKVFNL